MDSWLSARRVIGEKSLDLVFVGGEGGFVKFFILFL